MKIAIEEKEKIRKEIWTSVLSELQGETNLFQKFKTTKKDHKAAQPKGKKDCKYTMYVYEKEVGVKLEFIGNKKTNEQLFDRMIDYRSKIEAEFDQELYWRKDGSKVTRLGHEIKIDFTDLHNREKIMKFLIENILKIQHTTEKYLDRIF